MNSLLLKILFFIIPFSLTAQNIDSILFESNIFKLTKNIKTKRFQILNKNSQEKFDNLLFAKRIFKYYQILDKDNNLFYLSTEWQKKETVKDFRRTCGTVPHYYLRVKTLPKYFEIWKDETFYDRDNKIPAELIYKINIKKVDSIVFINGKSDFRYTTNFKIGQKTINPETLILMRKGKYAFIDKPEIWYDSIDFKNYRTSLKTMNRNLYGLLGVITPKYKRIENFTYYLAEAETVKGEIIYIDLWGNEYKSNTNKF